MTLLRLITLLALTICSAAVQPAEYIESFHSDIVVEANGDLLVTETIRVHAEGKAIKRGIYRDFPTRYRGSDGGDHRVSFELLSVKRNRASEPFHTKRQANGLRIYIGDADVFLSPGIYTYQLRYRTGRQLGYFENHDELYWNVTGNGWDFEIRQASARLILPETSANLAFTGYTGAQGSTEQSAQFTRLGPKSAGFRSTRVLRANEGLTIVAGWEKGLVAEPSDAQIRAWFISDHQGSIIVIGGVIALLLYYMLLWHWYGRDPRPGVIVPQYRPPPGYSPASMRYIRNMIYDKTCFTAAIINLAVKGALEINDSDGDFSVTKTGPARAPLAAGEEAVLSGLFTASDEISIEQANHRRLAAAIGKQRKSLARDYEKKYFNGNSWFIIPAVLASIGVIISAVMSLPSEELIIKTLMAAVFLMVPFAVLVSSIRQLGTRGRQGIIRVVTILIPPIVAVIVISFIWSTMAEFVDEIPLPISIAVVVMVAIHWLFYQLLKAPTLAGRRLLDKIEGFEHYLQVAEEDDIARQDAPQFSTEIYESYLPYAIALDLENQWNARLDRAIDAGSIERSYSTPGWYRGRSHSSRGFSTSLASSFNSAISASSVAPGSSSGSSGGFSGGGGGGGGGGGW